MVTAIKNDGYTRGESHISITGLIAPPRIRVLEKLHKKEIVEDVSDRLNVLLGQLMHLLLERANNTALSEKRFYAELEGVKISGQLDAIYDSGLVQDYKLVSLYSVKDGVKPEYEQQLNCYAALLRLNNVTVNKLQLVCVLRDWSKGAAQRDETIPQAQCIILDVKVWPEAKALEFIRERIRIHKAANTTLPECTAEERWAVPDKWAVMAKKGASRSLKNHDDKEMAEMHAAQVKGAFVELRKGKNNRCEGYCSVSQWCEQFKKLKESK